MTRSERLPRISALLATLALFAASCAAPGRVTDATPVRPPEAVQLDRAVDAALLRTEAVRADGGPYQVVGADEHLVDGRWIWRITLKPVAGRPDDPTRQPVMAGGELFVNVDLRSGTTTLAYGE